MAASLATNESTKVLIQMLEQRTVENFEMIQIIKNLREENARNEILAEERGAQVEGLLIELQSLKENILNERVKNISDHFVRKETKAPSAAAGSALPLGARHA